jgi:hypothetical protein
LRLSALEIAIATQTATPCDRGPVSRRAAARVASPATPERDPWSSPAVASRLADSQSSFIQALIALRADRAPLRRPGWRHVPLAVVVGSLRAPSNSCSTLIACADPSFGSPTRCPR